jgi:hypothetical protein
MIRLCLILLILFSICINAGTVWDDGGATYNWSEAANWNNPAGIPGNGANISFGSNGTYVNADISPTVGLITFNRQGDFIVNGPGTITINTGITTTRNNRTYTINAPITFGNNNTWTVNNAGTILNINGLINTNGYNLTGTGAGTINLNTAVNSGGNLTYSGTGRLNLNTYNEEFHALTLSSGTVALDFKTLTLDGNATFTGGTVRLSINNSGSGQIIAGNTETGNVSLGNGTTTLALNTSGFTPTNTDIYWIVLNNSNGLTSGYFAGFAPGSTIIVNGVTMYWYYGANYSTGSLFGGNDICLSAQLPEPSTCILFSFASLILFKRRIKHS